MGDPFVIQHNGTYYLFGTNASNEGFKCWESTDLVHWAEKGWAYRETDDSWAKSHYWAPEVEFFQGKFYMTYSAMNKTSDPPRLLIALAVSDKPEGPYRDVHAPWLDFGYSAIDGHIFVDDDGEPYLYFSRNGVQDGYSFGIMYGVALADDLSKPIGEPVKLMEADQPWEKVRYAENRCNEGAFVLKHGGRYCMTYSANHTGFPHYGIGYATADKPLGPWVKAKENPIAATNVDIGVSGPGHSCITRSPDGTEMFIVYHTHADAQKPSGDRVVNIDRIDFDDSDKLEIVGPTRSPQPMPSGSK
jgi:GH43 family beta-xylosidase